MKQHRWSTMALGCCTGSVTSYEHWIAATGDLLWQYSRHLPAGTTPSVKRSIAIYGNKVYLGTSDVHLVALDVKTGQVAWDKELATDKGFRLTGGPLVAKGNVMVGTEGRVAGGNYIVALDAETGKEAWRFKTIAQPGEPGGDTWNDSRSGLDIAASRA
jgi:alcohol dehydrogenase (cytochrome c)